MLGRSFYIRVNMLFPAALESSPRKYRDIREAFVYLDLLFRGVSVVIAVSQHNYRFSSKKSTALQLLKRHKHLAFGTEHINNGTWRIRGETVRTQHDLRLRSSA